MMSNPSTVVTTKDWESNVMWYRDGTTYNASETDVIFSSGNQLDGKCFVLIDAAVFPDWGTDISTIYIIIQIHIKLRIFTSKKKNQPSNTNSFNWWLIFFFNEFYRLKRKTWERLLLVLCLVFIPSWFL